MLWTDISRHMFALILGTVALTASVSGTAVAASEPRTKLVSCGEESCLLVLGRRKDAASPVFINGHEVQVDGRQKWRARVPMKFVREWSSPLARSVTVSIDTVSEEADLPIGLFAHIEDIAMLTITAK